MNKCYKHPRAKQAAVEQGELGAVEVNKVNGGILNLQPLMDADIEFDPYNISVLGGNSGTQNLKNTRIIDDAFDTMDCQTFFTEEDRRMIMEQALQLLSELKDANLLHRDFRVHNLMY